jgi:hypothetical protein
MSDMSDYLEVANYNYWFRPGEAAPTRPTGHTVSLWSAVTNDEQGVGTELTGVTAPSYVRTAVTFGPTDGGAGANSAKVEWPIAAGDWPTATHYGIHDHLGNLLQRLKPLASPVTVTAGNRAVAEIGDLQIAFN